MELKRCIHCAGSGLIVGGGMISKDCPKCDGKGNVENKVISIAKETDAYQAAKKRLQEKHTNLSDKKIEKLLDDALEKEKRELE